MAQAPAITEPGTVAGVLAWLASDPWRAVVRRWNYKAAVFSAAVRALLFLLTNLRAGLDAATSAMLTEAVFRLCTSGFYGALTQAFRRAEPRWAATVWALVVVPAAAHFLELVVHWWRGTPELTLSIVASVALTFLSTGFTLFAMRRGTLVVGRSAPSLLADVRALPGLIIQFTAVVSRGVWHAWW